MRTPHKGRCSRPSCGNRDIAAKKIMAGEYRTSCWFIDKPRENKLHPTMKPIGLITNALLNSIEPGDTAIVEYKNEHAAPIYASHPTYQAMSDLGTRAGISVFMCRYSDDFLVWRMMWQRDICHPVRN